MCHKLNLSRPNPGRREKNKLNFHFHTSLWCLIKPFEAPQRSMKIKIELNFYFNTTFRNARDVMGLKTMPKTTEVKKRFL